MSKIRNKEKPNRDCKFKDCDSNAYMHLQCKFYIVYSIAYKMTHANH